MKTNFFGRFIIFMIGITKFIVMFVFINDFSVLKEEHIMVNAMITCLFFILYLLVLFILFCILVLIMYIFYYVIFGKNEKIQDILDFGDFIFEKVKKIWFEIFGEENKNST